jgi:hypothetical protein
MIIAVVFEPVQFVRDNFDALLAGLGRTLGVSAIAIVGAFFN